MNKKNIVLILLICIVLFPHNTKAIENGWVNKDGYQYYYENNEMLKGIYEIDGKWYHFGELSGQLKKGWSITLDQREYYSDKNGVIKTGWVEDGGYKYYITKDTGAYKGVYEIDGKWYHFGELSKQLKTGWSITLDKREYYSDKNGVIKIGWVEDGGYKYYITKDTGAYKGVYEIDGKWYHFGELSKQLKTGWSITLDKREYYSDKNGVIKIGWVEDGGYKYYITKDTGAYKGVYEIDGKWYHFGELSKQLKKGWSITLDKREFYSNEEGELQFGWVEDGGYKYYITKDTGAYKGIHEIDEKWYHFGELSKQLKKGWSITLDKREFYSNEEGELQFGWVEDGGYKYYITKDTGAYKGIHEIDGKWYHFGELSKQLKIGWSVTLNNKNYYSNEEGVLQKGDIEIDGNWYSFNDDYSLDTGWQNINGKVYYFYADGTKAKYFAKIAGKRYEFSADGVLEHSNVKIIADLSKHNGIIDWNALWSSGEIDGVILRIGYSLGMDSKFQTYLSEAKRLNIPYSVYHFSIAENSIEAQNEANSLIKWYQGASLSPTYGVFYDIESWEEGSANSNNISVSDYDSIISTYKSALNNAGIEMSLYTGKNYAEERLSDFARSQISWIAQYASYCTYKGNYRGWQYTDKGKLPGINGDVDLSVFYY